MIEENDRFIDNGDETITDTKYNLIWLKYDYFQTNNKWCSWKGANKFVERLNEEKFASHGDWRLPTGKEARNLYDHECKNLDFIDDIVHIDYKFPEGCGSTYWCCEEKGHLAMAYNYYSDRGYHVRKKAKEDSNMTCRPVRTAGPKVDLPDRTSLTGRSRRD